MLEARQNDAKKTDTLAVRSYLLTELKMYVPMDINTGHYRDVLLSQSLARYDETKPNAAKAVTHQ